MKTILTGTLACFLGASPLLAGGIERAPQAMTVLFEKGNYAELGFGAADPTVRGRDTLGGALGDVTKGFGTFSLAYKHQFTENLSGALIVEQPFGADILYPEAGGSAMLGGTYAEVNATTFTGLLRYRFDNNVSVHGGLRASLANARIGLKGAAYGPLSGYEVELDDAWAAGFVLGAAYEIPEYAARLSLTYNSSMRYDLDTVETFAPGVTSSTKVKAPQSLTLEGQTGINPQTLLFGSIRWVRWSEFKVKPPAFTPSFPPGLVEMDNTTTYTIGIGRKFSEHWSGAASFAYEEQTRSLISPLSPTSGYKAITLAAIYEKDRIKVTTGISYTDLTAASPATGLPPTARARATVSHAWATGIRIGYRF